MCDGNYTIVRAILSQEYDSSDDPIAFESRKMNTAEVNYPTHHRETFGSYICVEEMEALLGG